MTLFLQRHGIRHSNVPSIMQGFAGGDCKWDKSRMLMAKADEQVIHFLFELSTSPPSGD